MKNLYHLIAERLNEAEIVELEEAKRVAAVPKGTKKPLAGKPAQMKDPVHLSGYGVMERSQADKHFPGIPYTSTRLHSESVTEQTVTMTIPFLIRVMEFAREDAKTDEDLHVAAEKMAESEGILDMADYDKCFGAS